ncbi:MAG: Hsp33 family molecular chaperone HslO [Gammaproteobacteria bacterium]|nr:Hsp33 family molecular chaperone HslO [Gammaproteobacteria bacterium]NVK86819.1 Hsp33 family molecular chaperone HslO [Gammaproteobacteria bacterium]
MSNDNPTDFIQRFLFEEHAVRGQWVQLEHSVQSMLQGHAYPAAVEQQLFGAAVAANLLVEILKFEGRMSLQIQSGGALKLLLIQANHQRQFRGVARHADELPAEHDLKSLMPGAQMALTIEPEQGKRYQGIVPMHHSHLAQNLEDYFRQSEQLATHIWIFTDHQRAVGLMLQAMPEHQQSSGLEHLSSLAATLSAEEALNLDVETILHRLFHQDPLRLFEANTIEYSCGCSRQKSSASLALVPRDELDEILAADGKVTLTCDFCQTAYDYDAIDIEQILANAGRDMQDDSIQ